MATISNLTLTIDRDVANAVITVGYTINWSAYDQLTNLQYLESWRLIGDDTGQDGDDPVAGDDSINLGLMFASYISSNGQASTPRTKTRTVAFDVLNEDTQAFPGVDDDEIRAVVTLAPQVPVTTSRESNLVTVNA